ncbi:nucleotidyltransferase family protein [Litoreibacter roseus]|nr:nucleotidyltransferase family protein [Litoreibacter roseus]
MSMRGPTITALLLAGGASSRMRGSDKLLEPIDGTPLLTRVARTCLSAEVDRVCVILPPDRPARADALDDLPVDTLFNNGSGLGLSHSLQTGLSNVTTDAVLIILADLPDLTTADLNAVIYAARDTDAVVVRGATKDGRPGHPVLVRAALFPELMRTKGDAGAQPVLKAHVADTVLVPLPGQHALSDLDTPEDWEAWRAARQDAKND